jgi:hypothetical protein
MEGLLAEDFLEIGLSGMIYDKKQVLQTLLAGREFPIFNIWILVLGAWPGT